MFGVKKIMNNKGWVVSALTALVVIVGMLGLFIAQPRLLRQLDLKVYDALLPLHKNPEPSPVPVIVDIDEASLAAYGQWPWPRYLLADLLDKITNLGAASIGVDILLAEEDRSSPEQMRSYLKRDKGVKLDFKALPENLLDYDKLLAQSLRTSPVVLGAYADFSGPSTTPEKLPPSVGIVARGKPDAVSFETHILKAKNGTLPLEILVKEAPIGFINMSPDMDGLVRQVPLVLMLDNTAYPSLSLRTLMKALGTQRLTVFTGPDGLEALKVGDYTVPVTPQGSMFVPFQGPRKTYPYISAKDVLQNKVSGERLQGKVVFLGTSAPGLLDIRATPLDRFFPGVEVHAAAVDTILSENKLNVPPWAPGAQIIGIILFGLGAALAFAFARPQIYAPVAIILLGLAVYGTKHFFLQGLFLSPVYVLLTVATQGTALLFLRFLQEERQKLMIRNTFSRYVSPEVVKHLTKLRGDIFAGEERELSIIFTDIRGFTSISEKLSPQQVVDLLNRYFTPMTAIVRQEKGTLDKFIGDALMAFWNAPLEVDDHPARAVSAALGMQKRLHTLNDELQAEFGISLNMGVGVHTGNAYVGNMGSNDLVNYTLIGDSVNLAARLEGLCAQYGTPVVVSEKVREHCDDRFAFQFLDKLRVKGKQQPVKVYTPMTLEEWQEREEEMKAWQAACAHYTAGNFIEASNYFNTLCQRFPLMRLYAVYAERALTLQEQKLKGWDGVWNANKK